MYVNEIDLSERTQCKTLINEYVRRYAFYSMFIGLLGVLFCWSILWCVGFVQDAFDAGQLVGMSTVCGISLIALGVLYLCTSEIVGYCSVRRVDVLASALHNDDVAHARRHSIRWLHSVGLCENANQIKDAKSVEEIRALVSPCMNKIDAKVDRLIAKESVIIGAFVGISPWPFVDGAIVAWRQLRLVKNVAKQYGVRPCGIGTLRLLRLVVVSVALADASEHLAQWVAAKVPSLGGLIPAAGQALAVIVLTVRLGRACKTACRPLKKPTSCTASTLVKAKGFLRTSFSWLQTKNCNEGEEIVRCSSDSTRLVVTTEFPECSPSNSEPDVP